MLNKIFPVQFSYLPIPIKTIGIFFLLIPFISFIATAELSFADPNAVNIKGFSQRISDISSRFDYVSISLNIVSIIVGLGILGVKRWGFFLFLAFFSVLIGHGVFLLAKFGFTEDFIQNLLVTLLPFFVILYFLNQEISTPYLTLLPRGFRNKWRIEIPLKGSVTLSSGKKIPLVTMDISPSGCLAKTEETVAMDEKVTLTLELDSPWTVEAENVREVEGNFGFKFRLRRGDSNYKQLDKYLSTKLVPRFDVFKASAEIEQDGKKFTADVVNISDGGFYLATKEVLTVDSRVKFDMVLKGIKFRGAGKVSWENQAEKFDKPAGYGIAIKAMNREIFYKTYLFVLTQKRNFERRER
ncbi:MAG TPA: PilZ domain-containing protein [Leptospiraceae bacterium]|nr:PilZ domain-containing protein [Leptospiraceae bacterium]